MMEAIIIIVAHVVLDNESKYAFITSKETNQVIQVDAITYKVVRKFDLGIGHSPHGLRYANSKLYVANMDAKSMSVIIISDGKIMDIPLGGIQCELQLPVMENLFLPLYIIQKKS